MEVRADPAALAGQGELAVQADPVAQEELAALGGLAAQGELAVLAGLAGQGELAAPAGLAAAGKRPIVRPRVRPAGPVAAVRREGRTSAGREARRWAV